MAADEVEKKKMSDAPEEIYTDRGGSYLVTDFPIWESDVRYRRADMPPTLEQALQVQEVKALVEAADCVARAIRDQKDGGDPAPKSIHVTMALIGYNKARTALRALKGGE